MKCPECDGTGKVVYPMMSMNGDEYTGEWEQHECEMCGGTGEIQQTNEEWFCQLPTYKKAILMANCYDAFKLDQYACNKHVVIEEWLKEIHDGE